MIKPLAVAATALGSLITTGAQADDYYVYLLVGQSNMNGYGSVSELPPQLNTEIEGARIFLGQLKEDQRPVDGAGHWSPVIPGLGKGAETGNEALTPSDRFGPELTFAARLRDLRPSENVAIIKYAKGGSGLDVRRAGSGTWDPHDTRGEGALKGINQYDHALATIDRALKVRDIDGDGEPDNLIPAGIVWMQGETDATDKSAADDYAENLAEIAELFRAALRRDDLPFVIGRITDSKKDAPRAERMWPFADIVRQAQEKVSLEDGHALLVTNTDTYGYSDAAHYDTKGYIDLGKQFAEAVHTLRMKAENQNAPSE